jgi:23S rRNA 5-hydroxycytidine C2501 synthase
MMKPRRIELLAPAKDLECGIEAIRHGADAVYIGANKFGARSSASNSIEDIQQLCEFAHLFNSKIYVTVNTILYDEELKETEKMIWDLYKAGVDALIIQDTAVMKMNIPPIALHASTQMNNRTPQQTKFLSDAGYKQIVLARELSLNEIAAIHKEVDTPLEVFVHGALCVSYSGQCYISQAIFGRSANRGECAQFCRLPFDMIDSNGKTIAHAKHLLSMKDLNQSDQLEELLDAGASSLKIEGRLKDVAYVKNVTAYYRQALDRLFARRSEYVRSSSGHSTYTFTPQPEKSFNRGFTHYFLHGRVPEISSPHTPKSLGEEMGRVKEIKTNYLTVAGLKPFHNGDGVCFFNEDNKLEGFRINRVETNRLFLQEMPHILPHTLLYRNYDQEFEKILSQKSAERKLYLTGILSESATGFTFSLYDEDSNEGLSQQDQKKETARTPQQKNIQAQLNKLGNTPFELKELKIELKGNWFIQSSLLAELRREAVENLMEKRKKRYQRETCTLPENHHPYPEDQLTYLGNVANKQAVTFYQDHGVKEIAQAFELKKEEKGVLMRCRYCLRYAMGWCPTYQKKDSPYCEPYFLVYKDQRYRLRFNCRQCEMEITKE